MKGMRKAASERRLLTKTDDGRVQKRWTFRNATSWTESREQSLEYEAGDKHRHALLRGLGLGDDSKTVNSVGMKQEELSQDEDEEILGAEEALRS